MDPPKEEKEEPKEEPKEEEKQQQQQQQKKPLFSEADLNKLKEYFKNPKNQQYLMMFLGVSGIAAFYSYFSMEEEITYTDFLKNYLEGNQVTAISIFKNETTKVNTANIMTGRGMKRLILGNVDHFLENLERFQTEKGVYPD